MGTYGPSHRASDESRLLRKQDGRAQPTLLLRLGV